MAKLLLLIKQIFYINAVQLSMFPMAKRTNLPLALALARQSAKLTG